MVHVLSDEEKAGYEHGFITAELIKKYAPRTRSTPCSFAARRDVPLPQAGDRKLALPERLFRRKMIDVTKTPWELDGYPQRCRDKIFNLTVRQGNRDDKLSASANETVLTAIERAGIKAPSRCRSGECGWCRSRMLEGSVFILQENELRRWADKEYGYIHPCSSFPHIRHRAGGPRRILLRRSLKLNMAKQGAPFLRRALPQLVKKRL